jgi:hypothetical protein
MVNNSYGELESLDVRDALWDRFFTVAPLVLVGTLDEDGTPDLAPKHMALPLGWDHYFGFVCTPRHATYRNIARTRSFTVSYPRPGGIVSASLTASPRCGDDSKPVVGALDTFPGAPIATMGTSCWRSRSSHSCTRDGSPSSTGRTPSRSRRGCAASRP